MNWAHDQLQPRYTFINIVQDIMKLSVKKKQAPPGIITIAERK